MSRLSLCRLSMPKSSSMKHRCDPLQEHFARQLVAEILVGPAPVHSVDAVDSFEEVRDPADAALAEGEGEVGKLAQHRRTDQVGSACTMLIGCSVIMVSTGASSEVMTTDEDEPICRHTIVFSSLHACQNGSQ